MIFRVQIYNSLETIRIAFQKQLTGEKAIAKLEDRYNRRDIYFSCEFLKGCLKKYYGEVKQVKYLYGRLIYPNLII